MSLVAGLREELGSPWVDFSGLGVRGGTVRLPVGSGALDGRRESAPPGPDRVVVIDGADRASIVESGGYPWWQPLGDLAFRTGSPDVLRVDGGFNCVATITGVGMRVRVDVEGCGSGLRSAQGVPVVLAGPDHRLRAFPDVDEARLACRKHSWGWMRGFDGDGYVVSVASSPRLTRWWSKLMGSSEVTSTTSARRWTPEEALGLLHGMLPATARVSGPSLAAQLSHLVESYGAEGVPVVALDSLISRKP